MRPVILALSLALLGPAACARQQGTERTLRGLLSEHGAVTLAVCGTARVYRVRAAETLLASLTKRVRELSGDGGGGGGGVVGRLRGEPIDLATSAGTAYPVHGTLWVREVHSVEHGKC